MPTFGKASLERLATCDERLQRVFNRVIQLVDCSILCGFRNQADQDKAFQDGFSKLKWPHGKHNKNPSLAVDAMRYPIDWKDEEGNRAFAQLVKEAAKAEGVELEWGGDWAWKDPDHYEVKIATTDPKPFDVVVPG